MRCEAGVQSVCCLLRSTEGQTCSLLHCCSFCSRRASLYNICSSCSSQPDSLHPGENEGWWWKRGGGGLIMTHPRGDESVCECMHTKQIHTLVYFIGDRVIQTCGFCNPRRGQRRRSSSLTGSAGDRDPRLCPFTPSFCPWGVTTAAARKEHQPLMGAQWLLFAVPRGERVVCMSLRSFHVRAPLHLPERSASSSGN